MVLHRKGQSTPLALLLGLTYLVFLAASVPHRVHHSFDLPEARPHAEGSHETARDSAPGHAHHEDTHHESASEEPCVILGVFEQHPSCMVAPGLDALARLSASLPSGPLRAIHSGNRSDPYRSRAPPFGRGVLAASRSNHQRYIDQL